MQRHATGFLRSKCCTRNVPTVCPVTQTQVGTFDIRRADMFGIGPTIAASGYDLHDLSWGDFARMLISSSIMPRTLDRDFGIGVVVGRVGRKECRTPARSGH